MRKSKFSESVSFPSSAQLFSAIVGCFANFSSSVGSVSEEIYSLQAVYFSYTFDDDPRVEAENSLRWMGLLKTLSAYQMYRREMEVQVARDPVLEFLLQCPTFPRSVTHCLHVVEECLGDLPRFKIPLDATRATSKLVAAVKAEQLDQGELHKIIDDLQLAMLQMHASIARVYFQFEEQVATT